MKKFSVRAVVSGALCCFFAAAAPVDALGSGKVSADDARNKGESIYRSSCMVCHSLAPPPKAAPPVKGLARHYRESFKSRREAVDHMVVFMQKPDASKAVCRKEAIKRFGLMPAMSLPESDLRKVSEWVWDQYDPGMKPGDHQH
ncbi:cytochrome c [Chlorobium sp.]|uniref:cytochrome c n=1 Tax=Chlorobium sp. TaxID=1095 RepID=UPI002F3F5C7E